MKRITIAGPTKAPIPPKNMLDAIALSRTSSLRWPSSWRRCVWKIVDSYNELGGHVLTVYPLNPEWVAYNAKESIDLLAPIPPAHLDPVVFEDVEDLNRWANLINRLEK